MTEYKPGGIMPSRRSFLKGALTLVAASVVAKPIAVLAQYPRIVGDGVHDDTDGLQAAFDGEPFECDGMVVSICDHVYVNNGCFRVTKPLLVRRGNITILSSFFEVAHNGDMMVIGKDVPGMISGCHFKRSDGYQGHGDCAALRFVESDDPLIRAPGASPRVLAA
jgi:hypothetical protein